MSKFYHVLKTHNIPTELENPLDWLEEQGFPIRGIISGRGGPTERLAGFIDHFLQPGMKKLGSFLKDTKHTLQIIEQINEKIDKGELSLEGVSLVSLDVEKMYNNITLDLGMGAAKGYLDTRPAHTYGGADENSDPFVTTETLMEGLDLCIQNNYFEYNKKTYKQVGGVGTGIKLAPPYACLAMGEFERTAFTTTSTDERQLLDLILLWKRFIDDVLLLFNGSETECYKLVDWLNSLMPGVIKLKCNFSDTELEFLDLRIMIVNGRLETEIFVKPTNLQLFLDYTSNHPQHCKDAIVYSQALRVIERCSQPDSAVPHLDSLKGKFSKRNYPEDLISKQFNKATSKDRRQLIFQKRKEKNKKDDKIRLIFTHNASNPPLHKWIREGKKLLKTPKAKEMATKLQVVTKQPKNLKQIAAGTLKKSIVDNPAEPGSYKCNHCRVSCPLIVETSRFMSSNTRKSYPIKQHMTCDSPFVLYLATCSRCKGQYVGKSVTPFKKRHSNHKQEVKKKVGGLGQHYGGARACCYQDMSIVLIEQVELGNRSLLAKREQFWQHQLRVYVENGGNAHCIRKDIEK